MNNDGLYKKYVILKNGEQVTDRCFVLKPEQDRVALDALRAYADNTPDLALGSDLELWIAKIEQGSPPEREKNPTYLDQDIHFDWDLGDGRIAHCREVICQPYSNCKFSAGLVTGIEPDTIYFMAGRNDQTPTVFFLRPDEAQAFAWVITGALWSHMLPGDTPGENPFK